MQAISRRYLSSLRRGGHYELLKYRGMSTGQDAVDTMKQVTQVAHETKQKEPMVTIPGQAFIGDYRSTSAVGTGDGLSSHTAKWWQPELGVRTVTYIDVYINVYGGGEITLSHAVLVYRVV